MRTLTTTLFAIALSTSFAQAQELSDEAYDALSSRVDDFDSAMQEGDMGAVFDFMPPQLLAYMAAQSGVDEATLIEASKAEIATALENVTIENFEMDAYSATIHTTPDGSMLYALVPTLTVMGIPDVGLMKATGETVAFEEDDEWYLVRVDDPGQAALLQAVYPAFIGVTFTPGTVEPVQ